jgi:hypothetical protein
MSQREKSGLSPPELAIGALEPFVGAVEAFTASAGGVFHPDNTA